MQEETYYVIVDADHYYVSDEGSLCMTNMLKYSKQFKYHWCAQNYIDNKNLQKHRIIKIKTTISEVPDNYNNNHEPITDEQRLIIETLLKDKSEILKLNKNEFPKEVINGKTAHNWIIKASKAIEKAEYQEMLEFEKFIEALMD